MDVAPPPVPRSLNPALVVRALDHDERLVFFYPTTFSCHDCKQRRAK